MNKTSINKVIQKDFFNSEWGEPTHSELNKYLRIYSHDSRLLSFSNVYVDMSTGLMFSDDFDLIPESAEDYFFWFPNVLLNSANIFQDGKILSEEIRNELINRINNFKSQHNFIESNLENIITIEDTCISILDPFGQYRFGHMHDVLQRLFSNKNFFEDKALVLLQSSTHSINNFDFYINKMELEFKRKITYHNKGSHFVFCKNVILPTCPTYTTFNSVKYYNDYIIDKLVNLNSYNGIYKSSKFPIKVFLSRSNFQRSPLNEAGLIKDILLPNNWIIIYGDESVEEIIWLFANAEKILGAHGSLFSNTMYCKKDCHIIELVCSNRPDTGIRRKYKRCTNYDQVIVDCSQSFVFSSEKFLEFL